MKITTIESSEGFAAGINIPILRIPPREMNGSCGGPEAAEAIHRRAKAQATSPPRKASGFMRGVDERQAAHAVAALEAWWVLTAVVLLSLSLPLAVMGQTASDDFNDRTDEGTQGAWTPYDPAIAGGGALVKSFPADGRGGFAYGLYGQACTNVLGLFQRGGSFRQEQYSDFSVAADIISHDEKLIGNTAFIGSRITTPGALTTDGYLVATTLGGPRNLQELQLALQFTGEVNATEPDVDTGGASLMPYLPASRQLRMYFTGIGTTFISEIYDRNDLLEPIARSAFGDNNHVSGQSGLGYLNATLDAYAVDNVTFDNYYSVGSTNIGVLSSTPFIGYPGTPQVVNLNPARQTLFYQPPGGGNNITFNITTFNTNQINTNAFKMFLNGVDVTSQTVLTPVGLPFPLGSPNTNFAVRYTGALAANTIYQGQIRAVDMAGYGTTNNWVFDTFQTNGIMFIEAEDYNYGGGQFFDNPPVSGLDTNGNVVNGGGLGYYDLQGVPCIDYNDLDRRGIAAGSRQQYRTMDKVGSAQSRLVSADTPRLAYITNGVNDYVVYYCRSGEWLNYTRTFPSGNYKVYLRASSQKAQAVRLDEITSGSTTYTQTRSIRGVFQVPNTGGSTRYRYTPLTDGAGNILTLNLSGVRTLRLIELESLQFNTLEAGDLQMNYMLFLPASAAPSPRLPFVAFASPGNGAENADPALNLNVTILNADTTVNASSIVLRFDGVNVTSSATITSQTTEGPGATVRYRPGLLLPKTSHTISVLYIDNASHTVSNQWSFKVEDWPMLTSADATGGSPSSQFTVQVNKSQDAAPSTQPPGGNTWPNDSFRAELQIQGGIGNPDTGQPFPNDAAGTNNGFYSAPLVNFSNDGNPAGYFGGKTAYPGMGPNDPGWNNGDPTHFTIAATIDLQLTNGVYSMIVNSDDGYQVTAGGAGATNVYLGSSETYPGSRDRFESFTFVVRDSGVYRFRLLHWQGTGGAVCEWFWVDNRKTGTGWRLINAPATTPTTIPASYVWNMGTTAPGFTIQTAEAYDGNGLAALPDSSARAESQLAGTLIDPNTGQPYTNSAAGLNNGYYSDQTINYSADGNLAGYFCADRTFPGIGQNDPGYNGGLANDFAMAATTLVQLQAGTYTFGVRSDDGFKVTTGANPPYTDLVLGVFEGGRPSSESQFTFVAPVSGLYPIRLLYYQGAGGADCEFYSFDPDSGQRVLINDPSSANYVRAYQLVAVNIVNSRQSGNNFSFDFQTLPGRTYTVEYKNNLTDPAWTALTPTISGDGTVKTAGPFNAAAPPNRFYHVKVN